MMQSVEEHQEIPTEEAAVIPIEEPRKRRRVWKLAADRSQKQKEGTGGYCGSRRRVTVAGKRTFRHATMAWWESKLLMKSGTQDNCGPPKDFAVAGMRTTRRARVAWRRKNFVRKDLTRNQAEKGTPKLRKERKRLWKGQEFNEGLREGLKQQPRSEIGIKGSDTRRQLRLKIKRTSDRIDGKTFRLKMVKRANEMSSGLRRKEMDLVER
jgi:hypothetical protein